MSARRQERIQLTRVRRRSEPAPVGEAAEAVERPAASAAASAAADRLLAEIGDLLSV